MQLLESVEDEPILNNVAIARLRESANKEALFPELIQKKQVVNDDITIL